ncbi:MAG: outer membrane lipoprotein-sorting protein [Luteolibacter sp.]
MNFKFLLPALALVSTATSQAQTPDAKQIMEAARISTTVTKLDKSAPLNGTLRPKSTGKKIPIALFLNGKNIQFQFSEDNGSSWQAYHMRLGDNAYNLFEIVNGQTKTFPNAKLVQPIAGTDLTYEDLSFRFFYWPNPVLEGIENVNGQSCYKLRLNKPKGSGGRYEVVYVWVHTKFGAFMRIRGHDKSGALLKQFEVEDVMQIDKNTWTLRKMEVATYNGSDRKQSITDVVFDAPKKTIPRGVR